jgi:gamma-glutamyltranspeptidase/glutathione hydrolase
VSARPQLEGFGDAVVTPHVLATEAGMEMLARGGGAVDAALSADAVLGVVAPETCGVGGDLFALVWAPGSTAPAALNASGTAGSGWDADALTAGGLDALPDRHPATVTVPGCVAGWEALAERFGRLPLATVLEPALRLASEGFPVSAELSRAVAAGAAALAGQGSASELLPAGRAPAPGERLHRPLLRRTLQAVAEGGAAAFYQGVAGAAISAAVDGRITADDLSGYRPEWVEPARTDVFGLTGWTIPPNSQGYLTLAAARVFEACLPPDDPGHPDWIHLAVEAYRSVAWERNDLVADPRSAPLDATALLAEERLAERAAMVDRRRAGRWPAPRPVPGGTAYLCAVDAGGAAVSFIQSNFMGIGSLIAAGEAGFFLHNRGAGFTLRPGHPNRLAPGKRPLHTLSPSLWTAGGRPAAVLGTRGGDLQPQLLLQVAARAFRAGQTPEAAQASPRWAIEEFGPGSRPVVEVEGRMPAPVVADLAERGHRVEVGPAWRDDFGPVSLITLDAAGRRIAAADPRVATTAAVVR